MATLPLAPRPLPGEALSSWLARSAARYDLSASALATSLLRDLERADGDTVRYQQLRCLDAAPWPDFDRIIAGAARLDPRVLQDLRRVQYEADTGPRWTRPGLPPWCQACAAVSAAEHGEFCWPAEWTFAAWVICPVHRCLLGRSCPCCARDCAARPIGGRLRLWCPSCARDVTALGAVARPALWPLSEPPRSRVCPGIVLDLRARKTLVRMQADLLRAVTGRRPTGPWRVPIRPERFLEAVRALSFLALAAAWHVRPSARRPRSLTPRWSLAEEPAAVAAGALAIVAAVLTSAIEPPWPGAAWTPELLRGGETPDIDAASLCWHLVPGEIDLLASLLPGTLYAYRGAFLRGLEAAASWQARNREAARRRVGFGGAQRLRASQARQHQAA